MAYKIHDALRHIANSASAATIGLTMVVASGSVALAAQSCNELQASIAGKGDTIYHYKDNKHPDLDLYVRYVKDQSMCGGGEILRVRPVPGLEDCYVPTCALGYGERNH